MLRRLFLSERALGFTLAIFGLLSSLFFGIFVVLCFFPSIGVETEGEVIRYDERCHTDEEGDRACSTYSIVRFIDSKEEWHEIEVPGRLRYTTQVRYLPAMPWLFKFVVWEGQEMNYIVLLLASLIWIVIGMFIFFIRSLLAKRLIFY